MDRSVWPWLHRQIRHRPRLGPSAALDAALDKLAALNSEPDSAVDTSEAAVAQLVSRLKTAIDKGFVFSATRLTALAVSLRKAGSTALADRLEDLANKPRVGPCADNRPMS